MAYTGSLKGSQLSKGVGVTVVLVRESGGGHGRMLTPFVYASVYILLIVNTAAISSQQETTYFNTLPVGSASAVYGNRHPACSALKKASEAGIYSCCCIAPAARSMGAAVASAPPGQFSQPS